MKAERSLFYFLPNEVWCKYWFISASNQLISTFWSENKFYSNFLKYLKRIASSNMIRLYYTKTMLYDAIYWGDSRSNFLNMMNTDNPHREFVHHILTLLWIDHNVSLSRGYVNVGLFACSVWYEYHSLLFCTMYQIMEHLSPCLFCAETKFRKK